MTATERIDAYLAGLPDDQRQALQRLRQTIAAAAPGAVEAISYGAPAFRYRDKPLVCYSASKAHVSFFPMSPAAIEARHDQLSDWHTSKGTIRFTRDHPLPDALVTALVHDRVRELDALTRRVARD
jgi:uncharacterized protein YdhG (YjbR/CyaY superfamily)